MFKSNMIPSESAISASVSSVIDVVVSVITGSVGIVSGSFRFLIIRHYLHCYAEDCKSE